MRQRKLVDPKEVERNDKMWEYYEDLLRKEKETKIKSELIKFGIEIIDIQEKKKELDEKEKQIKDYMSSLIRKNEDFLTKERILQNKGEFNLRITLNEANISNRDLLNVLKEANIAEIDILIWNNLMPRDEDKSAQQKIVGVLEKNGVDSRTLYTISNYRISDELKKLLAKGAITMDNLEDVVVKTVIKVTGKKNE
jgi:hypothetical protein